jgi:hypothetical protein
MEVLMNSLTIALVAFAFIFGGALAGMILRGSLPDHHFSAESKDVVKLGMGLVGTMAALILGLLVASAKSSFDAQSSELTQASANIVVLDRVLAQFGPETTEIRKILRGVVTRIIEDTWSHDRHASFQFGGASSGSGIFLEKIQALPAETEFQRAMKSHAWNMALNLLQTRWLLYEQGATSVSKPMVVIMVFWLTIVFVSWGLLAPRNATIVATLFTAALSVSGAIFLILEMYNPYRGVIQISRAPLQSALALLGQ